MDILAPGALDPLIYGLIGGFLLSMPVGPVNIFVLQRSITTRAWMGFVVGIGAALGDAIYGGLAAFGLGAIHTAIEQYDLWIRLAAILLLAVMAWRIWNAHPHLARSRGQTGMKREGLAAFILTIGNPGVFLAMIGWFTLVGLGDTLGAENRSADLWRLVLGVFAGALAWWATLSWIGSRLRERINDVWLEKINHITAIIIGLFALAVLISLLFGEKIGQID